MGRDLLSLGVIGAVVSAVRSKEIIKNKVEYRAQLSWEFFSALTLLFVVGVLNSLVTPPL